MKTSNIIILSTIGIIFSMNIWILADAKGKFEKENSGVSVNIESEKVLLGDFKHVVISDQSNIYLQKSDSNYYTPSVNGDSFLELRNDTLYISKDTQIGLSCKNLLSIEINDESELNSKAYESEYLKLLANDNSKFIAHNPKLGKLEIYSKEDARIVINNSIIDTANILATGYSGIGLRGSIGIVRGELKDDANLSVSGAKNTQFSKSDNAKINMY